MRSTIFAVLGLLAIAAPARAALVEVDRNVPGDALLTPDTVTGLEWLDLPTSAGRSWADIEAQLGPGGEFAGFRHGTLDEVQKLLTDAQLPAQADIALDDDPALDARIQTFLTLLGATVPAHAGSPPSTFGIITDTDGEGAHHTAGIGLYLFAPFDGVVGFHYTIGIGGLGGQGSIPAQASRPEVGHWLVRPVPEPSTAVLLGAGIAYLGLLRRQRR